MSTILRLPQIETIDTGINSLGFIRGYTLAYSTTTQLTVSAGTCLDSTDTTEITLATTKTLDISTSGVNGLDTGTITANRMYYVYVITNGTVVNTLLSLSATTPTMPGGYTLKRLVGCIYVNNSSNIGPFITKGKYAQRTFYYNFANIVFQDGNFEAGAWSPNNASPKTVDLSNHLPTFADSALINVSGASLSATDTAYLVYSGFSDISYRIDGFNNYGETGINASTGSYDFTGEYPLYVSRVFSVSYIQFSPPGQDVLKIILNGFRYEV